MTTVTNEMIERMENINEGWTASEVKTFVETGVEPKDDFSFLFEEDTTEEEVVEVVVDENEAQALELLAVAVEILTAKINDWKGRIYKSSSKVINVGEKYGQLESVALSASSINERRRNNKIKGFSIDIENIKESTERNINEGKASRSVYFLTKYINKIK